MRTPGVLAVAALAATVAACATCPTGACPPVCVVTGAVSLPEASLMPGAALAATGAGDLVAVYRGAGTLLVAKVTQAGTLRGSPVPLGVDADRVAVASGGAGDLVLVGTPAALTLFRTDALGAVLEEIALPVAGVTAGAFDVAPTDDGFLLASATATGIDVARYDAAGAFLEGPLTFPGPDATQPTALRLARGAGDTFALVGAAATGLFWGRATLAGLEPPSFGVLEESAAAGALAVAAAAQHFVVAWGAGDAQVHGVAVPDEGAVLTLARDAEGARPRLTLLADGRTLLAWADARGAHAVIVGDDGTPRGAPADLGDVAFWGELAATENGAALLWAPIPAVGETDLNVSFLACE